MNIKRTILAMFFFAVITAAFISNAPAETSNRVVAIVNDEVITLHELKKKIEEMTGYRLEDLRLQDENVFLKTRRKVLGIMIDERIAQKKIQELRIQVSPNEIDAAIEDVKEGSQMTHEDLLARLKKDGITFEKYREAIKKDLERIRLINYEVKSKIIIREEQLKEYYQQHKEEFLIEGRVHLAGIFLKKEGSDKKDGINELTEKGEMILARLRKGEDFAALAKEFSQGPGVDDGGDLGEFKTNQLEGELRSILGDIPEGGISDLIVKEEGIQIVKLVKREPAGQRPFKAVKGEILRKRYNEEVNKRYESWIKELRANTFTKIVF